jgi:hypothetical protein
MKTAKKLAVCALTWLIVLFMIAPPWVFAQDQSGTQKFSQAELDQMLAPIALYPDSLLAQIMMAATYPLEVVMADRWAKENKDLTVDQLNAELDGQDWDPSVKALVPFPQILAMMSEKLEWTENLGDAFLDQEEDVMNTIQHLRAKAREAGNLGNNKEQKVIVDGQIIVIEPINPDVIYIPVYNPSIVYGPWWYPDYPPFWYYPPGYVVARVVFAFPFFVKVGPAWLFAWGHWDWPHHRVYVNVNRNININHVTISRTDVRTSTWQHDVRHRRGVSYRTEATRERYRQTNKASVEERRVFRGFSTNVGTSNALKSGQKTFQSGGKTSTAAKSGQQTSPQYKGPSERTSGELKAVPQSKGPSSSSQKSIESSKDRTVFSSMDRGTVVKSESQRGIQSRRSVTLKGSVGNSSRGSEVGGKGASGGGKAGPGSDKTGSGGGKAGPSSDKGPHH